MIYEDFELLATDAQVIEEKGGKQVAFRVRVPQSPAGEIIKGIPTGYDAREMRELLRGWEQRELGWQDVIRLGYRLGMILFPPPVRDVLVRSLDLVKAQGKGLRIRLLLEDKEPTQSEQNLPRDIQKSQGELPNIPWEYALLNRGGGEAAVTDFLALIPNVSIVRHQAATLRAWDVKAELPARMVVALASPTGYATLDLDKERQYIEQALKENPHIKSTFVTNATLESLKDIEKTHLFHFAGHGDFEKRMGSQPGQVEGEGAIVLENEHGDAAPFSVGQLALRLRHAGVRVAVLGTCQSGRRDDVNVWSGVAGALLKAGLGAVVGMQHTILDKSAVAFAGAFYKALVAGLPIDEAVTNGRLAVAHTDARGWGVPVLYLRAQDGIVFPEFADNPTLAETREHLLDIAQAQVVAVRYPYFLAAPAKLRRSFDTFIKGRIKGFVGRQFVFDALDEFLRTHNSGYFVIRGVPGIGKSALMAKLVNDRGYVHHFNIATQNIRSRQSFLENACAQLIARYRLKHEELPSNATDDGGFLVKCLEEATANHGNHPVVLAIDALDESDRLGLAPTVNSLYLPEDLPEGAYIAVTTRHLAELRLHVAQRQILDLEADSEGNLRDISVYIETYVQREAMQARLTGWGVDVESFVAALRKKSQGNFMYLRHVLPAIEQGKFVKGTLDELPEGLMEYYQRHWRQMREGNESEFDAVYEPVVYAFAIAPAPVTVEKVAAWMELSQRQVKKAIERWREFLEEEVVDGQHLYRIYHLNFQEFLREQVE